MQLFWHETRHLGCKHNKRLRLASIIIGIQILCIVSMMGFYQVDVQAAGGSGVQLVSTKEETVQEITRENTDQLIRSVITYSKDTKDTLIKDNTRIHYGEGNVQIFLSYGKDRDAAVYEMHLGSAENIMDACLTDEEKNYVAKGGDIYLIVSFEDISADVSEDIHTEILDSFASFYGSVSDLKLGTTIDLLVEKKIGDGDWHSIAKLENPMQITLRIPDFIYSGSRNYYIIRNHDDICTLLEDNDEDSSVITFQTSLFSTFALVYHQSSILDGLVGEDGIPWHIITLVITMLLSGVLMLYGKNRIRVVVITMFCVGFDALCGLMGNGTMYYLVSFVGGFIVIGLACFQLERIYLQEMRLRQKKDD